MQPILEMLDVSVLRNHRLIVNNLSWTIFPGQHWVILGPNGAGKTTLLQLLNTTVFPSSGLMQVFGEILGLVDVFELRSRIGFSSASILNDFPDSEKVIDVVKTSAYSMTGTWKEDYDQSDLTRASKLLRDWEVHDLHNRFFKSLSEGEKKRVLVARALMANPEMLLLDEPAAGLDISGRESMVSTLTNFIKSPSSPVCVLVTHHVEEIPPGFTHALCIRNGEVIALGEIDKTLTDDIVSRTFDLDLRISKQLTSKGHRWSVSLR